MRAAAVLLCLSLLSCGPDRIVDGRPYVLRVPSNVGTEPLPLLVLLHGYGLNGEAQDLVFPFSRIVEEKRFLYAMPSGTVDAGGKRYWNATPGCCGGDVRTVDDLAFLRALVDDVASAYPVDRARVFLVGHSNGAFLSYRIACEAPEFVAGIAVVAGAIDPTATCASGRPVSVLSIHGTRDGSVRYDGGETGNGQSYPSALGSLQRHAALNGCSDTVTPGEPFDFVGDATAETRRDVFPGCPSGGAVELWSIEGGSHLPLFNGSWAPTVFDWLQEHAR